MARYTGSVCRLCRREGMKLFLKGDRCFTEKCAIEKRNYAPGQHGKGGRIKKQVQGYGLQLREKQKVKRLYGMLEGQFALTFERASPGEGRRRARRSCSKLERRLDNVVYRLGFGGSRAQAPPARAPRPRARERQARSTSRPTRCRSGDVITLAPRATKNALVAGLGRGGEGTGRAEVAELDAADLSGKVLSLPARDDVNFPIQEQLIVELYSK